MKIAILEDDLESAQNLQIWLSTAEHSSDIYATGLEFKEAVSKNRYDLFILDWMLPDINGDEILNWARNELQTEALIIFCTSRDNEQDIIKMLQLGADDYMVKPINPLEMLARIKAISRRVNTPNNKAEKLCINNISINLERHEVTVEYELCKLTPKEYDLTVYLLKHLGTLISREELLHSIWNIKNDIDTRTVDTHISRLRKKLKLTPDYGWNLNVVYQYGYRLDIIPKNDD